MDIQEYFDKENLGSAEKFPVKIKTIHLKKNDYLIKPGEIVDNLYFLNSGIIEAVVQEAEEEWIMDFFFEGTIFTAGTSMLTQQPTGVHHKCLTDCTIQCVSYSKLLKKCDTAIIANKFFLSFFRNHYLRRVKKEKDILTKGAETRYLELVKQTPGIIEEISINKIARYLSIHPNSLSRIRRKLGQQHPKRH